MSTSHLHASTPSSDLPSQEVAIARAIAEASRKDDELRGSSCDTSRIDAQPIAPMPKGIQQLPIHRDLDQAAEGDPMSNEFEDFIVNELEQQQLRINSLSKGLLQMERSMKMSTAEIATLAREQREKSGQHTIFMRRLEAEVVRGSDLRVEEARLRDSKLDRSLTTLRRDFEVKLKAVESLHQERLEQLEDKVDKMIVDVAVENQTLKTENMELRVMLQQVMAAASSNKKTLRVLTDEILKLKRQVSASSASVHEDTAHRLERGIAKAFQIASSHQDLGK